MNVCEVCGFSKGVIKVLDHFLCDEHHEKVLDIMMDHVINADYMIKDLIKSLKKQEDI